MHEIFQILLNEMKQIEQPAQNAMQKDSNLDEVQPENDGEQHTL